MRKLILIVTITILVFLSAALASAAPPKPSKPARGNARPVKVMTRNLYFGADLTPLVGATSIPDLAVKAAQVFGIVQATDFPARAKALAFEIEKADPHLIGLQEVALWRTGAPGVLDGPVTPATNVVYDFLTSLQSELASRGMQYSVVTAQAEFDAEVPSALGYDIRLTLRDVILA